MAELRDFRKEHDFAAEMESASIRWWEPFAPGSSPSNRLVQGEKALALAQAIEKLPDDQKTAIALRHLDGKKLSEISDHMRRTVDAVVGLMRRGVIQLKAERKSD